MYLESGVFMVLLDDKKKIVKGFDIEFSRKLVSFPAPVFFIPMPNDQPNQTECSLG